MNCGPDLLLYQRSFLSIQTAFTACAIFSAPPFLSPMQQRGIRYFFQSKQCRQAPAPLPYSDQDHGEGAQSPKTGAQPSKPGLQQFSRKRRRCVGHGMHVIQTLLRRSGNCQQPNDPSGCAHGRAEETGRTPPTSPPPLAEHNKQPAAPQQQAAALAQKKPLSGGTTRQLTQMHLDVGQRDFHIGRCAVCGLVYSKGEERDEKTHAAYHANATKGLRYQPLPNERVVLVDGSGGRVVVVVSGDTRPKKVGP